jgi:hypothetical protein
MVVPGLPHHVTQRGNRREAIFFEDGDQQLYCDILAEQLGKFNVEVWAYCLMPNHVHLILTPQGADGMLVNGYAVTRFTLAALGHVVGYSNGYHSGESHIPNSRKKILEVIFRFSSSLLICVPQRIM